MMIEVDGHEVEAVLDTGSGMTIMSNEFLETTLEAIIQESSNVDLIDVNGRKKRVLGKVTNVPITVQGERLVNLDIQVTEVTNYKIILGNDWLVKVKSEIKPAEEIITLCSHGFMQDYPITVFKNTRKRIIEGNEEFEEQEVLEYSAFLAEEEEYEDFDIIEKIENEEEEQYPDLDEKQKEQLIDLLWGNNHMFADDLFQLGKTEWEEHRILTEEVFPIKQRERSFSIENQEFIREEVKRMLAAEIIEPACGSWSSEPVIVGKKNGSKRFCVDFRPLNAVTIKDKYPLPKIETILTSFNKAKYYTTLDMASGYWQILVAPEYKEKTALRVPNGFYQFNRMPFGLCNAPATFQRLMDNVL